MSPVGISIPWVLPAVPAYSAARHECDAVQGLALVFKCLHFCRGRAGSLALFAHEFHDDAPAIGSFEQLKTTEIAKSANISLHVQLQNQAQ